MIVVFYVFKFYLSTQNYIPLIVIKNQFNSTFQCMKAAYKKTRKGHFTRTVVTGQGENGLKLKDTSFRLDIRK